MRKFMSCNLKQEIKKYDFIKMQEDRNSIFIKIVSYIDKKSIDDELVQLEISKLYDFMCKSYDCSIEMFRGLAETYVMNEEFKNILSKAYGNKMPEFLSKSMEYFCNNK